MDGKKGDPMHNKNVGVNRTLKTKWPLKHTAANRNFNIDVGVIVRMCKCWPMTNPREPYMWLFVGRVVIKVYMK